MRDYGKVSPHFWIGRTGKELRQAGPESQLVALYLLTSPHANMIGLYYMPLAFLSHETGLSASANAIGGSGASWFAKPSDGSAEVFISQAAIDRMKRGANRP